MTLVRNQQIEFDEFSRTCDLVEEYFADTIDAVAVQAPVSRRQLVAVLAWAQLTGRERGPENLTEDVDVVYQSNAETLCWLDGDFWRQIRALHDLTPDESRSAREVHRRILEAVDGDVPYYNRERDTFVLVEWQYPRE
jgi:hypothetical protein